MIKRVTAVAAVALVLGLAVAATNGEDTLEGCRAAVERMFEKPEPGTEAPLELPTPDPCDDMSTVDELRWHLWVFTTFKEFDD